MIQNFMNSPAPSPFPADHDPHDHRFFFPNYQQTAPSSSPSHVSYSVFFSSSQAQDHPQPEYSRFEMDQDQQPQREDVNHVPYTGSHDLAEKKHNKGLKITLWKNNESQNENGDEDQENPAVKWMSSKMRLMQKMKKSEDHHHHHHQKQPTSFPEADHFSSNSNSTNNSHSPNTPFRVCADCNTTKTPLWRSGPKGPKSLCNACGIRQRKARRAMAAAAAAAAANGTTPQIETKTSLKIKVHAKERVKNNGMNTPFKKRSKMLNAAAGTTSHQPPHAQQKSNVFEDFLLNLSKNLAFQRVFPQDEKEAAILLMALSCGLVHG